MNAASSDSNLKPQFNHGWTRMDTDKNKALTQISRIFTNYVSTDFEQKIAMGTKVHCCLCFLL
jgi:hypothetical protein